MELERLLAVSVMALLGIGTLAIGWLGRGGRLDFALGGWTQESASDASWRAAHVTIGSWLMVAGDLAFGTATLAGVMPVGAIGPTVVIGAVALLVPVVIGVVAGTGKLHRR